MDKFESSYRVLKRIRKSALEAEERLRCDRVEVYKGDLIAIAAGTLYLALVIRFFVYHPLLWMAPAFLCSLCVLRLGEHSRALKSAKERLEQR